MIYFTADLHLGHANIIKYCNRPFANVQEMDEAIITRWNETVGPTDQVYILGDLTLGQYTEAVNYLCKLSGAIYMQPGSHDRWLDQQAASWPEHVTVIPPLYSLETPTEIAPKHSPGFPLLIVLCHYAMRRWDRSHYGSLHLFGHSHGGLGRQPIGRSMDIGVDCWDFRPVSLETVKKVLLAQPLMEFQSTIRGLGY